MIKVKDIDADEFIRTYALRTTGKRVLQFALLLSIGDSPEAAARMVNMDDLEKTRAINALERLGFVKVVTGD